jgi:hypothetical protein
MLGVDFSERFTREAGGAKWSFKLLPFGKLEELQQALNEASRSVREADAAGKEGALRSSWPAIVRASCELVRWSVIGCDRPWPTKATERAQYDGAEHEVLTAPCVEALAHVSHGLLVNELARHVVEVNDLPLEVALGFPSPSTGAATK